MKKTIITRKFKTKHLALFVCVFFVVGFALSATFICTHANHVHDQNGIDGSCETCAHVMAAATLLETLSIAMTAATLCLAAHHAIVSKLKPISSDIDILTLASLKVRLNN
jgi:uncharacterized membrane protein